MENESDPLEELGEEELRQAAGGVIAADAQKQRTERWKIVQDLQTTIEPTTTTTTTSSTW